jgi:hypothetical protein
MSGAIQVAEKAREHVEQLITDMLEGDHQDNQVSLGLLICGDEYIQVQLKITRNTCDFLDDDEFFDEDGGDYDVCQCGLEGGEMYHNVCDNCAVDNDE